VGKTGSATEKSATSYNTEKADKAWTKSISRKSWPRFRIIGILAWGGELNEQEVKLVKFRGEFVWHHHESADEEAPVLLFEPAGTLNAGNVRNERTVDRPAKL
jgi:hypothetical protein